MVLQWKDVIINAFVVHAKPKLSEVSFSFPVSRNAVILNDSVLHTKVED